MNVGNLPTELCKDKAMPSPADSIKASSLVYRVSGLPLNKSIEEISYLLARALRISYQDSGLKITSLAVDPYQAARQIATVTFLKIPPALSATGRVNQWPINLSGEESDPDMGAEHTLIFDTHFQGLTPLNTPIGRDEITDCLVICGLGGHAFGSFKEKCGSYMWLRDSLPKALQGLRVLLYGYESGLDGSYSNQNVSIIADNLARHTKELSRYAVSESQVMGKTPFSNYAGACTETTGHHCAQSWWPCHETGNISNRSRQCTMVLNLCL